MGTTIRIDQLGFAIADIMSQYATDVTSDMKAESRSIAKEIVEELKKTSPEGSGTSKKGHYKKGWTSKVTGERATSLIITVYNRTKPGLTHLLEKGHAKRGGGRVNGSPHIAPVEKRAEERLIRQLKARIER